MPRGDVGGRVVEVRWVANPLRGDRFETIWTPVAERALDYGAYAYAFFRARQDQAVFTQLAFFDSELDFERYWSSREVSEARIRATGLFQVPVHPEWHAIVGFGQRATSPVEG